MKKLLMLCVSMAILQVGCAVQDADEQDETAADGSEGEGEGDEAVGETAQAVRAPSCMSVTSHWFSDGVTYWRVRSTCYADYTVRIDVPFAADTSCVRVPSGETRTLSKRSLLKSSYRGIERC